MILTGYNICTITIPTREVDGDDHYFIEISGSETAIVLGNVSSKNYIH